MKRFFSLLCIAAAAGSLHAASKIRVVEPIEASLSPSRVVDQLRLDLASPELPVLSLDPPAEQGLATVVAALRAAPRPPTPEPGSKTLDRIELARSLLSRFSPGEFEKKPAAEQEAALAGIWDAWKERGLIEEGPAPEAFDRVLLEGVNDKRLTHANKSVFLGAAVLGYPLQDAVWLSRTRISDAIDESSLHYPSGQRWVVGGTPEFLGTTSRAQQLVDAWGAAAKRAAAMVNEAETGEAKPHTDPREAAFAELARELHSKGDLRALAYLSGEDPTLSAFLLDVRKPGYYVYNGDRAVIERILAAPAAAGLGIRRLEQGEGGAVIPSLYLYRPGRVLERLRELRREPAEDAEEERRVLDSYRRRLGG